MKTNQGVARLDYQFGAHKLQFTYFDQQGDGYNWAAGGNTLFNYSGNVTHDGQSNYILGDTWAVSPKLVNNVRVYYSLNKALNSNAIAGFHWSDLGSQIRDGGGGVTTQPQMTITGFMGTIGTGGSGPANQSQLNYGIQDTVNWDLGRHEFKLGGGFNLIKYTETASFLNDAKMTFNNSGPTGEALSNWITGHPTTFQQNNGSLHRVHSPDPSLFAADDWRVSRRFTANLGVRWEVYYPYVGQNNFGTFQAGVESTRFPTAPLGVLSAGDPGVPDGILHTSYTKFAPRVGFAWDVLGTGRTSLRGSYGIFYSASQESFIGNLEQAPFALAIALSPPAATSSVTQIYGSSAADPFPYTVNLTSPNFPAGASYGGLPPNTSAIPYVQEYNLTAEQQFGDNWSARISYVGNNGKHFYIARDQNAPVFTQGATTATIQARRPLATYSSIGLLDPSSNSSFNSLQAVITHRFAHGFSLLGSYVWEKEFDIASADPGSFTAYTLANEYCVACDRGLSTLETPQRFVASYTYQAPSVHIWGIVGKELINGWRLAGITTLSTGGPFNILSNVDTNSDGTATDRPNQVGNPNLPGGRSHAQKIAQFFNTAAFVAPGAVGSGYGNAQRDPIVGPGYIDTDLNASKRFVITHEAAVVFRGELFNAFNNVNFSNPNGTVGNGNYGKITGTSQPRIIQFALRVEF